MTEYTENQKSKDFDYFKSINKDYFSEHGHCFLAIKNSNVLANSATVNDLISVMNNKNISIGSYLIQECTGEDSAFTNTVMRLIVNG